MDKCAEFIETQHRELRNFLLDATGAALDLRTTETNETTRTKIFGVILGLQLAEKIVDAMLDGRPADEIVSAALQEATR